MDFLFQLRFLVFEDVLKSEESLWRNEEILDRFIVDKALRKDSSIAVEPPVLRETFSGSEQFVLFPKRDVSNPASLEEVPFL